MVAIATPLNNATISGTVSIAITKSANVSWVNVYLDGNYFASTPPLSFNWNTTTVANGAHQISATAFAANASVLGSASINVTVANAVPTPTPTSIGPTPVPTPTPTAVQIAAPANGANVVGGAVPITITKSASVSWVNVYIDGEYFASTPPLTFSWNSTTVPDGNHTISAIAFAANATQLGTASITMNVAN